MSERRSSRPVSRFLGSRRHHAMPIIGVNGPTKSRIRFLGWAKPQGRGVPNEMRAGHAVPSLVRFCPIYPTRLQARLCFLRADTDSQVAYMARLSRLQLTMHADTKSDVRISAVRRTMVEQCLDVARIPFAFGNTTENMTVITAL